MSTATVTLTQGPSVPVGNVAYAKTTITLTDSAGAVQTATVNGSESPPWTAVFSNVAAVAGATGTVSAQDVDAAGANMGAAVSATFTEIGTPLTFTPTNAVNVAIS
jgi:hypothetical protein